MEDATSATPRVATEERSLFWLPPGAARHHLPEGVRMPGLRTDQESAGRKEEEGPEDRATCRSWLPGWIRLDKYLQNLDPGKTRSAKSSRCDVQRDSFL